MALKNMNKKWKKRPRKRNEDEEEKENAAKKRRRYEQDDFESKEELREFLETMESNTDILD